MLAYVRRMHQKAAQCYALRKDFRFPRLRFELNEGLQVRRRLMNVETSGGAQPAEIR